MRLPLIWICVVTKGVVVGQGEGTLATTMADVTWLSLKGGAGLDD